MCDVDNYYNGIQRPAACGNCGGLYEYCGTTGQPDCCPAGYTRGSFGSGGSHQGSPGQDCSSSSKCAWDCVPIQPSMDDTSKLNCCMNTLPSGQSPNGYCATGYCQNSDTCKSFLNNYCNNPSNVASDVCLQYCNSDEALATGACDTSITSYCSNSTHVNETICGCALPRNNTNYPGYGQTTPNIPVPCYSKCQASGAIKTTSTKSTCNIGAITVCNINNVDFTAINSSIGGGITLSQNCTSNDGNGNNNGNTTTATSTFKKVVKSKWMWIGIGIFLLLLMGLFIFLIARSDDDTDTDTDTGDDDGDDDGE